MNTALPYPLQWPDRIPRSPRREAGKFRTSYDQAHRNVRGSLTAFARDSGRAITDPIMSSNINLLDDKPRDPGVAVWFTWDGLTVCIPVDRYATPAANLQAIHHVIEARRTELRHGTLQLVRASLEGFRALPPPAGTPPRRSWAEVLGFGSHDGRVTKEQIDAAYRLRAKKCHPDAGGSDAEMAELAQAKREALAAL